MVRITCVLFISILFITISCSTRVDYFEGINKGPVLKIKKVNDTAFLDKITDSIKIKKVYKLNYKLVDEEKQKISLQYENLSGNPGIVIIQDSIIVTPEEKELSNKLKVFYIDSYKKQSSVELELVVFKNLIPVAKFSVSKVVGGLNNFEYVIDASKSYEKDARFGGKINLYEFKVGTTFLVQTPLDKIHYIFPSAGIYSISVRVKDNEGEWCSEQVSYVTI